jgi:hypothetical protein
MATTTHGIGDGRRICGIPDASETELDAVLIHPLLSVCNDTNGLLRSVSNPGQSSLPMHKTRSLKQTLTHLKSSRAGQIGKLIPQPAAVLAHIITDDHS